MENWNIVVNGEYFAGGGSLEQAQGLMESVVHEYKRQNPGHKITDVIICNDIMFDVFQADRLRRQF